MNAADYRRQLKTGLTGTFLFCGEEEYMKRFCLEETRKSITEDESTAAFNIVRFCGSDGDFSFGRIADFLSVPPFFCKKKLAELHDFDFASPGESAFTELAALISKTTGDDGNIFIIYAAEGAFDAGTERRRTKLFDRFSEILTVVEFVYEVPAKLAAWLNKHFQAENITAGPEQCSALIQRCGPAMYSLSGETAKLCAYLHAAGRNKLTDADIRLVTCAAAGDEDFALSNAVLTGDTKKMFRALEELKAKKEKPELILSEISGALNGLKLTRVLSEEGLTVRDIALKTKQNEYKISLYQKNMRRRSTEELDALLVLCADTDWKIKSTGLDNYMLIDRLAAFLSMKT